MILSCSVRQNLHAFLHIFLSRLTYAFTPSSTLHSGLDPSIPSLLKALYWGEASGGQLSLKTVPILFLFNLLSVVHSWTRVAYLHCHDTLF